MNEAIQVNYGLRQILNLLNWFEKYQLLCLFNGCFACELEPDLMEFEKQLLKWKNYRGEENSAKFVVGNLFEFLILKISCLSEFVRIFRNFNEP